MIWMFANCNSLVSLPNLLKWNTPKIFNSFKIFYNCFNCLNIPSNGNNNYNNSSN